MNVVCLRVAACVLVEMAGSCGAAEATTEGRRDKKPHIAARSGGCSDYDFWIFAHTAVNTCEVRDLNFSCDFSGNPTSQRNFQ